MVFKALLCIFIANDMLNYGLLCIFIHIYSLIVTMTTHLQRVDGRNRSVSTDS